MRRLRAARAGIRGRRVAGVRTGLRAALLCAALLWLAGCGVPPSGVIQAGGPATGMPPELVVYLLNANGPNANGSNANSLVAAPRQSTQHTDVATAVRLLFAGPTAGEAGSLTTRLPDTAPTVSAADANGAVVVRFRTPVDRFGELAMEQLVCTVSTAFHTQQEERPRQAPGANEPLRLHISVRVISPRWEAIEQDNRCPGAPRPTATDAQPSPPGPRSAARAR